MCPKCRSSHLSIRQPTGFERIMILLTSKRKFLCRDCMHKFRMPDRRQTPRRTGRAFAAARSVGQVGN